MNSHKTAMRLNRLMIFTAILIAECLGETPPVIPKHVALTVDERETMHPKVDIKHWADLFPLKSFYKTSGPRKYLSSDPDDLTDLWKPSGQIITSLENLCEVELLRKHYEPVKNLGTAVPVDIFMWSVAPPTKPYLTKLGGVPHRESSKPWPTDKDGKAYTFIGQFCFVDSKDIVSEKLPGDVMLIFFQKEYSFCEPREVHIEWSSMELASPLKKELCPQTSFTVPQLSGHIYRTNDFPESQDVFEQEGHDEHYLFGATQATKIGRETWFIQNDPRSEGTELFCVLNSLNLASHSKWPFIDLETLPEDWDQPDDIYGWGRFKMMFFDVGCMYFLIDEQGNVTCEMDSY